MQITRTSPLSGITRTMELDVTEKQMALFRSRQVPIQDCFPHLSADDREFILTGITAEEWDQLESKEDLSEEE
jgi:hypothetical protein